MQADHDNLRAALAWAASSGAIESELRLAVNLTRFWWWRGLWSEGLTAMSRALEWGQATGDGTLRVRALGPAGSYAALRGEFDKARKYHEEGLAIARGLADRPLVSQLLGDLGRTEYLQGRYAAASAHFAEALALFNQLDDQTRASNMIDSMGNAALELGDFVTARRHFVECLRRSATSHPWSRAVALSHLSNVDFHEGRYQDARARCEESLAIYKATPEARAMAMNGAQLGAVLFELDERAEGLAMLADSLSTLAKLGDRKGVSNAIGMLTQAVARTPDPLTAARLWGAAERLLEDWGIRASPRAQRRLEAQVEAARAEAEDPEAFHREWQRGRQLDQASAVRLALEAAGVARQEAGATSACSAISGR